MGKRRGGGRRRTRNIPRRTFEFSWGTTDITSSFLFLIFFFCGREGSEKEKEGEKEGRNEREPQVFLLL